MVEKKLQQKRCVNTDVGSIFWYLDDVRKLIKMRQHRVKPTAKCNRHKMLKLSDIVALFLIINHTLNREQNNGINTVTVHLYDKESVI